MARIVVAIGGNALGYTPEEQIRNIREAVPHLLDLIEGGNEVVFTHGNGPQVGIISAAFDTAHNEDPSIPMMELPESTAMSQGYIGYHLQQQLRREIERRGLPHQTVTLVTQVEVDSADPAFDSPTKPIGTPVDEPTANAIMEANPGVVYKEDSGRGWRRVVASPKPQRIAESGTVDSLVQQGVVVIACGGGGVPVARNSDGSLGGVPAVIDKDLASAELAEEIGASRLIILTDVPGAKLNYGKPNQTALTKVTSSQLRDYADQGHFASGSMLPKVTAAIEFVGDDPRREAVIAALEDVGDPDSGTRVVAPSTTEQ